VGRLDPEQGDAVGLELAVGSDERAAFDERLGQQHTIERVGVMRGKSRDAGDVGKCDRKLGEATVVDAGLECRGEAQSSGRG
jgi:hypothetical protein